MGKENERIMRKKEVVQTVGLSEVSIWRAEKEGRFPRRLQLGGNSVGWLASEIYAWVAARAEERQ